jgi:hypothetical protein
MLASMAAHALIFIPAVSFGSAAELECLSDVLVRTSMFGTNSR